MSETGEEPTPVSLTADPPVITPTTSDAGTVLIIGMTATNTSGRAIEEGEIAVWLEAKGLGAAEAYADAFHPWWAIGEGEQAYLGGQLQVDPGDWDVHVQVMELATSRMILDYPGLAVHVDGTPSHAAQFDESQPHAVLVFIESAEVIGLECRLHYTITNATRHPIPPGMKVTGTLQGTEGGFSGETYNYTEALPPLTPVPRYLTLSLVDLSSENAPQVTARVIVDPSGPAEVEDEVQLTFNGTGPVTLTRT